MTPQWSPGAHLDCARLDIHVTCLGCWAAIYPRKDGLCPYCSGDLFTDDL